MTKYYVMDGHTLGYVIDERPEYFGVLAGKPQHGGYDWENGYVIIMPSDNLKPATEADFEYFRVCPKGHIA